MLTGEYRHSLDPKNRIFIPAKHREELGETFMNRVQLPGEVPEGLLADGVGGIHRAD